MCSPLPGTLGIVSAFVPVKWNRSPTAPPLSRHRPPLECCQFDPANTKSVYHAAHGPRSCSVEAYTNQAIPLGRMRLTMSSGIN